MAILHFGWPIADLIQGPWRLLGILPLMLGILLNISADKSFTKYQTTVKPFEPSRILITTGMFRWSRNPMYLGMTLLLFGIGTGLGSLTPFGVVILFAVLMDRVFVRPEESKMEREFGNSFQQYKKVVRRWI
jgi:protein-S-isoprenylcysteine O-methyltransferase Ste14